MITLDGEISLFYSVVFCRLSKRDQVEGGRARLEAKDLGPGQGQESNKEINKRQGKKEAPMQTAKRRFKQESRKPGYSQQQLEDKAKKNKRLLLASPPPSIAPTTARTMASFSMPQMLLGGCWVVVGGWWIVVSSWLLVIGSWYLPLVCRYLVIATWQAPASSMLLAGPIPILLTLALTASN